MAYLGNPPATGQNNSFRVLDDITSYTLTFDGSSSSVVNSTDKTIESRNHRFVQGQRVVYAAGGGTPVANLTGGTAYFIIKQGGDHFQLATSATNASNGVAISISAAGSATSHTLIASFDAVNTRFLASHSNGSKVKITRSAQLNISINGVIQEPQETATPTAGFGHDSGSVIVFSSAPNAGDAFWGSLVADNVPTFDISDNDVDNFTGDDSTTDFTLSKAPPDNRNILVTLDGVTQYPSDNTTTRAYNVTENILSFTSAPSTSVSIQVRHIGFAGATSGSAGVSAFYGRTGSVVLKNTDTINVANIVDEGYLAVGSTASFGGDVSIGGTLTYDDVTYVEAIGFSTFREGLRIPDSKKILLGTPTAGGCQILHDSSDTFIQNKVGDLKIANNVAGDVGGDIYIQAMNGEDSIKAVHDGQVELSFNGNKKFETIGYGVTVVGAMQVSGMTTIFNQTTISTGDNQALFLNHPATNGQSTIAFQSAGSTKWIIGSNKDSQADQDFFIFDNSNSTHRFNIKANGNIGIGSDDPQAKLDVTAGAINNAIFVKTTSDKSQIQFEHNGGPTYNTRIGSMTIGGGNVGLLFETGTAADRLQAMVIDRYGFVGIGTNAPIAPIHIVGVGNTVGILSSTSNGVNLDLYDNDTQSRIRTVDGRLHLGADHNNSILNSEIRLYVDNNVRCVVTGVGITVIGEVAASQDYPNFRPTLNFNFTSSKKLDPRITYERTGPASYVNEFGKVVLVGDNEPRFDYGYEYVNANSSKLSRGESKGLLIETTRTNLVAYSIYDGDKSGTAQTSTGNIGNWSLTLGHATFTGGIDAPDGSNDAVRFTSLNTGSALFRIPIPSFTPNGSDTYTLSFYARGISGTGNITFDLGDGAPMLGSWNQYMITNEWVRIVHNGVPSNAAKTFIDIMSNSTNNRVFDIWGVQLEKGSFPTSFIPTHGSTAIRGYEEVLIDGDDFTDFYNPLESTVVCEFDSFNWLTYNNNAYERIWSFNNGSESDVFEMFKQNTSNSEVRFRVRDGGANVMGASNISYGTNIKPKMAFALKLNDAAVTVDGTIAGAGDSSIPMPTPDRLILGNDDEGTTGSLNGHIRNFSYYPVKLPDSQVITLTL
tara:strand:- start:1331 stop:4651 length:3321 start_codon:yes stop_codon:yes gene_type:complete